MVPTTAVHGCKCKIGDRYTFALPATLAIFTLCVVNRNAAVTRGDVVQVIQEAGCPLWQKNLPAEHPFEFGVSPKAKAKIWITAKVPHFLSSQIPEVYWHPRVLWVGIGFQRGTSRHLLEAAIEHVFREHQLAQQAIAKIVTIDTKAEEVGLAELCQKRQWALKTFAAEVLRSISVPHPSPIVEKEAGTPMLQVTLALCFLLYCS